MDVSPAPVQFILAAGVALAAAAPIGPITILTSQRAISLGFWPAFWPTLGAAAADGIYGCIAALGSGYLSGAIMGNSYWIRLVASFILVTMGIRLYKHHNIAKTERGESFGLSQLAFLNFTLVLSNPLTLGFYIGMFALFDLRSQRLLAWQSFILSAGVVCGTLVWFVLICTIAGKFHSKVEEIFIRRIRAGVGMIFLFLGFYTAASVLIGKG